MLIALLGIIYILGNSSIVRTHCNNFYNYYCNFVSDHAHYLKQSSNFKTDRKLNETPEKNTMYISGGRQMSVARGRGLGGLNEVSIEELSRMMKCFISWSQWKL